MWPWKRKSRQRRANGRKAPPGGAASAWRRFRGAGGPVAVLLGAGMALGVVLMDVWPVDPLPYRAGQYVPMDITARATFVLPARERLEEATRRAMSITPAVFELDGELVSRLASGLKAVPDRLEPATQPSDLPEDLRSRLDLPTAESLTPWRAYTQPAHRSRYEDQVEALRAELAQLYLVRKEEKARQRARGAEYSPDPQIWVVHPGGQQLRSTADLIVLDEADKVRQRVDQAVQRLDEPIRHSVRAYLLDALRAAPLYRHNQDKTSKAIEEAIRAIQVDPSEVHQAGKVLVPRSLGQTPPRRMTAADVRLLEAEQGAFRAQQWQEAPWRLWLAIVGRAGVLLLASAVTAVYVARYRPEVVARPGGALSLLVVVLGMLAAAKITCHVLGLNPFASSLPVLMAAFILTIAHDQRFALAVGAILGAVTVFLLRAEVGLLAVLTGGVVLAVLQLHEIRTRSKIVLVSAASAGGILLITWAQDLAFGVPFWPFAVVNGAWGAGFALLAGFLVQGILPLIEQVFGVATSMTLLEWCDANKPLLRRLATEAPGTHSHSLQLGQMCEAAADAIGARGLLARVGAYYHDVGKINKPEYFVENQGGATSKHAKLSPAMSQLIITGHVKDGLELAREYGLPRVLQEFITTHHGTTLVQYFYQAEAERRKAGDGRAPDEHEFRYPGPRPRSKEAAILMLADATESSVRSMHDPAPGRIENQVHAMLTRRLMDGQLDECDLTLREISTIEESLTKSLCAMYHSRVAYPTPSGQKPSAAEMPPAGKTEPAGGSGPAAQAPA